MAGPQLTDGALAEIMRGGVLENPILQILGSKRIDAQSAEKSRYRILLSDGKYKVSYAMYTVQANDKFVVGGEIAEFTVIKLKNYLTSTIATSNRSGDKSVLIILEVEVLKDGKQVGRVLGSPEALPSDLSTLDNKENKSSANGSSATSSSSAAQSHSRPSTDYEPTAKKPNLSAAPVSLDTSFNTAAVMPITSLSPYQNKWVIKAKVTSKGPIRTWSNSKGEGKLFSFDVLDESGEIRITAFKEMVDKYYDFLRVEKIYYISKCQVKMANKRYSSLKSDYELTLSSDSIIQECADDGDNLPAAHFNFTKFDAIAETDINALIDIIGVCKQVGECQTFTARTSGRELKKREITLVDDSKCSIGLTLWGEAAETFSGSNDVVTVKGARIQEYNGGKTLSVPNGGAIKLNPEIKEAYTLRGWYDKIGQYADTANLSARTGGGGGPTPWLAFKQVQTQGLGASDRGDYYQNVATILLVRSENLVYLACANEACNKKVIDLQNGKYRCEKCNVESPEFRHRLIGNMNLGDWSGSQWATVFNQDCEYIFGAAAQDIGAQAQEESYMQQLTNEANFKQFQFRYRVKTENFNDNSRLQTVAVKAEPVNYKTYNAHLISQIQALTG